MRVPNRLEDATKAPLTWKLTRRCEAIERVDLSVLQIQARLIGSRSALIGIRNERLSQRVNLHLALGGSFE